jgi:hypothetical protein
MKAKEIFLGAVIAIVLVVLLAGYGIGMGKLGDYLAGMGEPLSGAMVAALRFGDFIRRNLFLISAGILVVIPVTLLLVKPPGGGESDD